MTTSKNCKLYFVATKDVGIMCNKNKQLNTLVVIISVRDNNYCNANVIIIKLF